MSHVGKKLKTNVRRHATVSCLYNTCSSLVSAPDRVAAAIRHDVLIPLVTDVDTDAVVALRRVEDELGDAGARRVDDFKHFHQELQGSM